MLGHALQQDTPADACRISIDWINRISHRPHSSLYRVYDKCKFPVLIRSVFALLVVVVYRKPNWLPFTRAKGERRMGNEAKKVKTANGKANRIKLKYKSQ